MTSHEDMRAEIRGGEILPSSQGDAALDARNGDAAYLEELGYTQELKRVLGPLSSFCIQFSTIAVASALYTTIGVGFGYFGPAAFWSFVVGGALQVFFVGVAVAELVSAYPLSGGVYQIVTRITRRPWLGWQTGWLVCVAHIVSIPAIAVAIAPLVAGWFGVSFSSTGESLPWVIGLIAAGTVVNIVGVRLAAFVNNLGVVCELVATVLVIGALLLMHHDVQPLSVFTNTAGTTSDGWLQPVLFALVVPTFIISAFDATGNAAEETTNASRSAPIGQISANAAGWLIGVVFFFLLVRAIPNVDETIQNSFPGRYILESAVGHTVTEIFEVAAVLALFACNCIVQLTGVRVMWSQARDGQMPAASFLHKVSSNGVPVNATLVSAAIAVVFVLWSSALAILTAMVALAWALAYTIAVIAGFVGLADKRVPARPFSTGRFWPAIFGVSIVWSVILCTALVLTDPQKVGGGILLTIAVGTCVYFAIPSTRRGKVASLGSTPGADLGQP